MNKRNISNFIKEKFKSAPGIFSIYKNWMNRKIKLSKVEEWIEESLLEKWKGVKSLRALNIMQNGMDAQKVIVDSNKSWKDWKMKDFIEVPGSFAPVKNVFHVSQALSWIASRNESIEKRLEMLQEIPVLMKDLICFCSKN